MDIGSAKITREEMQGIPHYLIDVLDPREDFNVVKFKEMADEALSQIYSEGRIPIVTGGTGFYVQALLYDIDFTSEDTDLDYRDSLMSIAKEKGAPYLHDMLRRIDPNAAEAIHPNNIKRVIRAIEFNHLTGQKISEHNEAERGKESPYNYAYFVLNDKREKVYERIDLRVDKMIEYGLVDEVTALKEMGCTRDMVSMQGLGYKEMLDLIDGKISLDEAIYIIKRETRHFAKRQITWFKRERDVIWLDRSSYGNDDSKILDSIIDTLREKEIFIC
jgi:tRNA dimethylallyltransferase